MRKSYVIDSGKFAAEFARCCKEYNDLKIAVAWCGNPNQILPYKLLDNFSGNVKAIVGIAFNHTHPDAIDWFLGIGADLRVFKDDAFEKRGHPSKGPRSRESAPSGQKIRFSRLGQIH